MGRSPQAMGSGATQWAIVRGLIPKARAIWATTLFAPRTIPIAVTGPAPKIMVLAFSSRSIFVIAARQTPLLILAHRVRCTKPLLSLVLSDYVR